jgi:nucleotide-binding universal stress UspA family protein
LDHALYLAEVADANIDLIHVCNVPHYVRPDLMVWVESGGARPMSEIAREQAQAEMSELVSSLEAEAAQRVTSQVYVGTPAATIVKFAEDHPIDLIVMGTHGRTGLEHLMLGSVAEKVVRRAPCPVLVVRESSEAKTLVAPEPVAMHERKSAE